MNSFKRQIYKTQTNDSVVNNLIISSTQTSEGIGTLNVSGGVSGETITAYFNLVNISVGLISLSFPEVIGTENLTPAAPNNTYGMVLDGFGNFSSSYAWNPIPGYKNTICNVTISTRNSGLSTGQTCTVF